jgi:hypothetical protein
VQNSANKKKWAAPTPAPVTENDETPNGSGSARLETNPLGWFYFGLKIRGKVSSFDLYV